MRSIYALCPEGWQLMLSCKLSVAFEEKSGLKTYVILLLQKH